MPINADWYKRRNAIDQELGGRSIDIADVRIVQNDIFRGSRERGPCARHFGTIGAGAAGHNVGLKIDAIDGSAASSRNVGVWIHQLVLSQTCSVFIANRSAITLQAENPLTPACLDADSDVVPRIFEVDMLTADIPTAPAAGIPSVTQAYQNATGYTPPDFLPGIMWFENTNQQSLFVIGNSVATIFHYNVAWQGVRL